MLTHPVIDKLHRLKCLGMATALTEQLQSTACEGLSFEERLGLLVDRELTVRDDRRMTNRLRRAKLWSRRRAVGNDAGGCCSGVMRGLSGDFGLR